MVHRVLAMLLVFACACQGSYEVRVFGEAFVEEGIPASAVRDGWEIRFTEFVVSIGEVSLEGDERVELAGYYVFDLTRPSDGEGHLLAAIDDIQTGNYAAVRYRFEQPGEVVGGNATAEQLERLKAKGTALHVVGEATRGGERVGFDWDFSISFGHSCKIAERVRASDGGSTQLTIHADHLLLDDLGPNGEIAFDLIAASDVDSDGVVLPSELAQTSILPLERYQTAGVDIDDLWTYVGNLALTLGHVDGEGGCDPVYVPARYAGRKSPGGMEDRGATLYAAQCASCHGEHGGGDGPMAEGMDPRPSNLTALPHVTLRDDYLYFRIAEGGGFFPYASAMPGVGASLPEADVWALVDAVYMFSHGH
ncbi:MAG: cytochrome c [Myxococcales bacterium]|nr:cytochrome c [Myxococcales bacterium]